MTRLVRSVIARRRLAADLSWRRLPRFTLSSQAGDPTIYYLAPHLSAPSGGVRNIYRHVDALNAAGIPAAVIHDRRGYRCRWFANDTRVHSPDQIALGPDDVLVVPECYGPGLGALPAGIRTVIFNQGAYHTFDLIPFEATGAGAPYTGIDRLAGLLTVSRDSADLLRFAFPELTVHLARLVIDAAVFHPAPHEAKPRIAYLTHRRDGEREQLLHMLRSRGVLDGWELVPIAGRTERETAEIMRSSAIFLSLSEREGFGLPPAEAMASGCYVIGYPGQGGREYFDPRYCAPIPDGDLLAFATAVAGACVGYRADPGALATLGRAASKAVLDRYSARGLAGDLLAFYRPIIGPVRTEPR